MSLQKYSMHVSDVGADAPDLAPGAFAPSDGPPFAAGAPADRADTADRAAAARLDPEIAARGYLAEALASPALPGFTAPTVSGSAPELKCLGTESVPLLGTKVVKFRQLHHRIPVYGSFLAVELDADNALVSVDTTLGDPVDVDPVATISPAEAAARVTELAGVAAVSAPLVPQLNWWLAPTGDDGWHLAYIFEDVPFSDLPDTYPEPVEAVAGAPFPAAIHSADVIVDAHTGAILDQLSRTHQATTVSRTALDDLSSNRTFDATDHEQNVFLIDLQRRIGVFEFGFRDAFFEGHRLPGNIVTEQAASFDASAVSAHANTSSVADFYRNTLQRLSPDGTAQGSYIASVDCAFKGSGPELFNAFWDPVRQQMIYGQFTNGNGQQISLAAALDVVAHEITHGVTDSTARLEYARETGALNESYSDIIGAVIANTVDGANHDPRTWEWRLGASVNRPLRSLEDPTAFGQPDHMKNFQHLPNTPEGDHGGVHVNSGIHNKAAHLLFVTEDDSGDLLMTPIELAVIFYVTLVSRLTRQSTFSDSRRSATNVAKTLFANDPARATKIAAIDAGFDAVGIV